MRPAGARPFWVFLSSQNRPCLRAAEPVPALRWRALGNTSARPRLRLHPSSTFQAAKPEPSRTRAERARAAGPPSSQHSPRRSRRDNAPSTAEVGRGRPPGGPKKSTLATIQAMERAREERRQQMEARKDRKEREKLSNAEKGVVGDVDFVRMISAWRDANKDQAKPHATFSTNEAEKNAGGAICICVRKRPISRREVNNKDHDAVSCVHPSVVVHDCRLRVDGISKYLNNQQFAFDHAFSENEDTAEIYRC